MPLSLFFFYPPPGHPAWDPKGGPRCPGIKGRCEGHPLAPKRGAREEGEGAQDLRPLGRQRAALKGRREGRHEGRPLAPKRGAREEGEDEGFFKNKFN